jgi:DNA-directed RNA polymerase specialized sigma24 family protein
MTEQADTTEADAAAARERIEKILARLPPAARAAFWKAVRSCYTLSTLPDDRSEDPSDTPHRSGRG